MAQWIQPWNSEKMGIENQLYKTVFHTCTVASVHVHTHTNNNV